MKKIIIVYKSETGFTEKYAGLLAEKLGCETAALKTVSAEQLSGYEIVIYGSRVLAGRLDGLAKIKKLIAKTPAAKMIVFATGGTPAEAEPVIDKLWRETLSPEEQKSVPHFYMPSGLCYEKMSLPSRLIMKLGAKMMSKAENKDSFELGFEQALRSSYDISDEKYIIPLTEYISSLL